VPSLADFYARVSPHVAHRPGAGLAARIHARVLSASGGRLGRRLLGADVLVMRTTGRRSGQVRESPAFFVAHGDAFAVVASNAASQRFPAWWLNLQANPDAEAFVQGSWRPVRARRADEQEAAELWPKLAAMYGGYDLYRSIATREMPVVLLEPRA
jgi:deazaflavin-dependent oxidoreductase (nitroreductase family)